MDCYNCGTTLNRKTRSAEHILPNSIGGKRKAYNLLCKTCNEQFGRSIDHELASKLARFYSLLQSEAPAAPSDKKDGNIAAHDRFIAAVKKNRSFSANPAYFRSIAKICLNYYLSKGYSRDYCQTIKAYIRGEHADPICFYYIPDKEVLSSPPGEDTVTHLLHLYGNKDAGVLYAYIELFNMQNLVVIFSMNYDGKDINATYCRDVIRNEEIPQSLQWHLNQEQLQQLAARSADAELRLYARFERILRIIQQH